MKKVNDFALSMFGKNYEELGREDREKAFRAYLSENAVSIHPLSRNADVKLKTNKK